MADAASPIAAVAVKSPRAPFSRRLRNAVGEFVRITEKKKNNENLESGLRSAALLLSGIGRPVNGETPQPPSTASRLSGALSIPHTSNNGGRFQYPCFGS
jgi:hypothetical protein